MRAGSPGGLNPPSVPVLLLGPLCLFAACGEGGTEPPPAPPNNAPIAVGTIAAQAVVAGESVSIDAAAYFSDPDGDALTYSATSAATGVATTLMAGSMVTIQGIAAGTTSVKVTATDPAGLQAAQGVTVIVEPPNRPPVAGAAIQGQTVRAGSSVVVDLSKHFSEPDGDELRFSASSSDIAVATASVDGDTLTILGVAPGAATVTVTASDPGGLSAQQAVAVAVTPANRPPRAEGTIPLQHLAVGDSVALDASRYFSDPDGDALAYTAESSDEAVTAVAVNEHVVAIRAKGQGTATVTITATDPDGLSAAQSTRVNVRSTNRPPRAEGTIPPQHLVVGDSVALDASRYFSDPDGDALAYTAESSDEAVIEVAVNGHVVAIRAKGQGSATVTIRATDPGGLSAAQSTRVNVRSTNRPPRAEGTIPPQHLVVGDSVALDASRYFSDPDGDALAYTAESSDEAVATVAVNGRVVAIRAKGQGSATVTITATDPGGLSAGQTTGVTIVSAGYQVLRGLRITAEGGVTFGGFNVTSSCLRVDNLTVGGRRHTVHWTQWEVMATGGWAVVGGTRAEGRICPYDLSVAPSGEYRLVGEMQIDGVVGRYRSENTVTVSSTALLRDDFSSEASLDRWHLNPAARATIEDGHLTVSNTEEGWLGLAYQVLDTVANWEVRTRVARAQTNVRMIVWMDMVHDVYPAFIFEIGSGFQVAGEETNFRLYALKKDRDGPGQDGWVYFTDIGKGVSDAIRDGANEWNEWSIAIVDGTLSLRVNGQLLEAPARLADHLPRQTDLLALGTGGESGQVGDTAFFDWVELNGEVVGSNAAASAIASRLSVAMAERMRMMEAALARGDVKPDRLQGSHR